MKKANQMLNDALLENKMLRNDIRELVVALEKKEMKEGMDEMNEKAAYGKNEIEQVLLRLRGGDLDLEVDAVRAIESLQADLSLFKLEQKWQAEKIEALTTDLAITRQDLDELQYDMALSQAADDEGMAVIRKNLERKT